MKQDEGKRLTMELLDDVKLLFEAEAAKKTAAVDTLNHVLALWPELHLGPEQTPTTLPVCRHLSRTLDLAKPGPAASVATAIDALEPTLLWAQSARHTKEIRGADFMNNYGYCSLGITGSDILDVGLLLLGPGITYPVTSYPSRGVFLVIGGAPEWKSGDEAWRRVRVGDIIHRPFDGAEGKRPGKEPMLAFYAWLSE